MIGLKINCFSSQEQANEFVSWFVSHGEQMFNDSKNTSTLPINVDIKESYDKTGSIRWSGNTGVLILKE